MCNIFKWIPEKYDVDGHWALGWNFMKSTRSIQRYEPLPQWAREQLSARTRAKTSERSGPRERSEHCGVSEHAREWANGPVSTLQWQAYWNRCGQFRWHTYSNYCRISQWHAHLKRCGMAQLKAYSNHCGMSQLQAYSNHCGMAQLQAHSSYCVMSRWQSYWNHCGMWGEFGNW